MAYIRTENWSVSRSGSANRTTKVQQPKPAAFRAVSEPTSGSQGGGLKVAFRSGKKPRYRAMVNKILADREGTKTWPMLERLESLAEGDKGAQRALQRLDLLSGVQDYRELESPAPGQTASLVKSLDESSPRLAQEGWKEALNGVPLEQKINLLNASTKDAGWKALGYPETITGNSASRAAPGWEDPTRWRALVENVVRRQSKENEGNQTYREYRKLLAAYRHAESGNMGDKVDSTEMWFDIHRLEEQLRPEQLEKARNEVKAKVTDNDSLNRFQEGGKGRGRRFLSALSQMPDSIREQRLHEEFSMLSLKSPEELRGYAEFLQQEAIKRGKDASSLNPLIQRVFSKVTRETTGRPAEEQKLTQSDAFRRLVEEVMGSAPALEGKGEDERLRVYREGLTVGGMTRNYVISRDQKKKTHLV